MRARLLFALAGVAALPSCISPSVLEAEKRAIESPALQLEWTQAAASQLEGLFESVELQGEMAEVVWRIEYHFSRDGSYSGAALVLQGARPEFQTLSGRWRLEEGRLLLDDAAPALALAAPGHLRIQSEQGSLTLRSVSLR
ncbi:MAG: hypothetical protein JNJ88_14240 [Planctomycetes bacterium]|nr:hypothetical protein [Planctomycetota bacterium]